MCRVGRKPYYTIPPSVTICAITQRPLIITLLYPSGKPTFDHTQLTAALQQLLMLTVETLNKVYRLREVQKLKS